VKHSYPELSSLFISTVSNCTCILGYAAKKVANKNQPMLIGWFSLLCWEEEVLIPSLSSGVNPIKKAA